LQNRRVKKLKTPISDAPGRRKISNTEPASSKPSNKLNVQATLSERGEKYGSFKMQAIISQRIKNEIKNNTHSGVIIKTNWIFLSADQKEALEMIAHKIARILNGDPNYIDSWIDIAGYAQLVANRLKEEQK
jgi:Domain of unknown function (DUF6378)